MRVRYVPCRPICFRIWAIDVWHDQRSCYKVLLYCVWLRTVPSNRVPQLYSSSSAILYQIVIDTCIPTVQAILYLIFILETKVTESLQSSIILCLIAYRPMHQIVSHNCIRAVQQFYIKSSSTLVFQQYKRFLSDFHFRDKGNKIITKFYYILSCGVPSHQIVSHNRIRAVQAILYPFVIDCIQKVHATLYLIYILETKVTESLQSSITFCLAAYRPIKLCPTIVFEQFRQFYIHSSSIVFKKFMKLYIWFLFYRERWRKHMANASTTKLYYITRTYWRTYTFPSIHAPHHRIPAVKAIWYQIVLHHRIPTVKAISHPIFIVNKMF